MYYSMISQARNPLSWERNILIKKSAQIVIDDSKLEP